MKYLVSRKCAACAGKIGAIGVSKEDALKTLRNQTPICEVRQRIFGKNYRHLLIGPVEVKELPEGYSDGS